MHVAVRLRSEPDVERVRFARECFEASLQAALASAQDEQRGRLVVPG